MHSRTRRGARRNRAGASRARPWPLIVARPWPAVWRSTATTCASCPGSHSWMVRPTRCPSTGSTVAVLLRPARHVGATTEVLSVHPQAQEVPRNLLRFYVVFSGPMSEGHAREHLRLVNENGAPLHDAFLSTDYELWDGPHRRLTVLLDPARIKRGLAAHRQAGYPTPGRRAVPVRRRRGISRRPGRSSPFGCRKALRRGPRRASAGRAGRLEAAQPLASYLRSTRGQLRPPPRLWPAQSVPHVMDPGGRRVPGAGEVGPDERSWRLVPAAALACRAIRPGHRGHAGGPGGKLAHEGL